jgi:acyl-CoA synthetase (AMP-forming)/AMP-acid ligase II
MLNLPQYASLGAALRDAVERWPNETCLIEADRDKEKTRLTYSDFKEMAMPLARALQDADFKPDGRAAVIMTNQSKWLISAYAGFLRRRSPGSTRLQTDRRRASSTPYSLEDESPGRRILFVARDHAVAGFPRQEASDCAGD